MITLGKYIDFKNAGENTFLQAQVITGLTKDELREKSMDDINPLINKFIDECKEYNDNKLQKFIQLGGEKFGKKFGFHPNLDNMTFGEYLDLNHLLDTDFTNNLPKIMSILYRPVVAEFMHNYEIEKYDSAVHLKNADLFREIDMTFVNGAMVFFCLLREDMLSTSLKSLSTEMIRQMEESLEMIEQELHSHLSMDGGTSSRSLQTETSQSLAQ
jgi:hypothetical protein